MQLEHWLLNAAAMQQSRVVLLNELRDASERGVRIQPVAGSSPVVRGWLELAPLAAESAHNPTTATADLTAWVADHPGHPAVEVVRSQLLGEQPQPLAAQAHIALLLPISGPAGPRRPTCVMASSARTIKHRAATAGRATLRHRRRPIRRRRDCAGDRGRRGHHRGTVDARGVVAAAMDRMQHPPLLALNFLPDGAQAPPLFFQFALSPVEEAKLVARRVMSDGHSAGVAIVPSQPAGWGSRVLSAFTQQLQSGGGTVLASIMIDTSQADYSDALKQVLGIDQSSDRLDRLESLLGTHLEFVPRRREDIQFIFLPRPPASSDSCSRSCDSSMPAAFPLMRPRMPSIPIRAPIRTSMA